MDVRWCKVLVAILVVEADVDCLATGLFGA